MCQPCKLLRSDMFSMQETRQPRVRHADTHSKWIGASTYSLYMVANSSGDTMHSDLETKQSDLGLACMSLWRRQFEWRPLLKVVHGRQFMWRHHASTTFHAPIHLPINTSTPSTLLPHHHSHYFFYNTSSTISSATISCSFICTNRFHPLQNVYPHNGRIT